VRHFIEQLEALAKSHKTDAKWIFVPTRSLAATLPERLLHRGCDWANFRFVTPFEVALEMVGPVLVSAGIRPKPEELGPSLIARLATTLPDRVSPYFRPLLSQPGMDLFLWRTLNELRMAGIEPKQLSGKLEDSKEPELVALLQAYLDYLSEHRMADRAEVLLRAARLVSGHPTREVDLLLEAPFHIWSPVERRFLDSLPGQRQRTLRLDFVQARRLDTLGARSEITTREAKSDSDLLQWLSAPDQAPQFKNDGTLQLFAAGRRDAELKEVKRRIVRSELSIDQVEILLADAGSHDLAMDCFVAEGWPCTSSVGSSLISSRLGQALIGLLDWFEKGYPAFRLRELFSSQLLRPGGVSSGVAASILDRTKATWMRASYLPNIKRLRGTYLRRAESDEEIDKKYAEILRKKAAQAESLGDWLRSLFQRFRSPSTDGFIEWATWVEGLLETLREDVVLSGQSDRAASARLERFLSELLLLESFRLPVNDFVRTLRHKLSGLRYGSSRCRAGHLHISQFGAQPPVGRLHTFVVGLEEGRLERPPIQDAVLSDDERRRIHPGLRRSRDDTLEAEMQVLSSFGALDGHVTLSFSNRCLDTGQELLPSWHLFNAARLRDRTLDSYETLYQQLGEPIVLVSENEGDPSGWWFRILGRQPEDVEPVVFGAYPHLARGSSAQQRRESATFTQFDGWVPGAARELDPRSTMNPISVSRLQNLAECPFRYFLEHGLGLVPPSLELPDADQWLDARTRGSILHEVYASYYRELRGKGWAPVFERDRRRLREHLSVEIEKVKRQLPVPSAVVEKRETLTLRNDLENFLRLEESNSDRTPVGFEVGFGMSERFHEPLARCEPVTLDFGDWRLPLRGRIDRLDRLRDGYEVVDYKTGRKLSAPRSAVFDRGRLLQYAVYALVAENLLGVEQIMKSSYYFPTTGAERTWRRYDPPAREEVKQVLEEVLDPLDTGAFVHTHRSHEDCRYCDFRRACGAHTDANIKAKLENQDNGVLESRRRLLETK
jgi:RecB family exonuclease